MNSIRLIRISFLTSLKHIFRFRQALIGGLTAALLMFLTAYSQGHTISKSDIIPYVGSWYGMTSYLISATICSSFVLFIYDSLPSLVFLNKFSQLKFWHFIGGLLVSFLVISFITIVVTYPLGFGIMFILGHGIKSLSYIKEPGLMVVGIFAMILFQYSLNILLSIISRLSKGKLLIASLNGAFLLVVIAGALQSAGFIRGVWVYIIPFNAILTLLIYAAVGEVPELGNLFISPVPSNHFLLVLSVVFWSILFLVISSWLFNVRESYMAEET